MGKLTVPAVAFAIGAVALLLKATLALYIIPIAGIVLFFWSFFQREELGNQMRATVSAAAFGIAAAWLWVANIPPLGRMGAVALTLPTAGIIWLLLGSPTPSAAGKAALKSSLWLLLQVAGIAAVTSTAMHYASYEGQVVVVIFSVVIFALCHYWVKKAINDVELSARATIAITALCTALAPFLWSGLEMHLMCVGMGLLPPAGIVWHGIEAFRAAKRQVH